MAVHLEKCKNVEADKCKARVLPASILGFLIPNFLEDTVRAHLQPIVIQKHVALYGFTSRYEMWPCVPCTVPW